jgi:putative ATP-dependent endonuclease of OLD family
VRISKLRITNHTRIADLDLDIRGHAVIVGANDVGKSSLLRMLNLTLGASAGQLYQQLTLADLQDPALELTCDVIMDSLTDAERTLFPNEIDIDPADQAETLPIRLTVAQDVVDPEAVSVRRWFPVGVLCLCATDYVVGFIQHRWWLRKFWSAEKKRQDNLARYWQEHEGEI